MIKSNYTFGEIIELQKLPLSDKIAFSVEVLKQCEKSRVTMSPSLSPAAKTALLLLILSNALCQRYTVRYFVFSATQAWSFPSLAFARKYGKAHYGDRFIETKLLRLDHDELRYDFARELIERLESEGALDEVLKADGKLKGQGALITAAKKRGYELNRRNCYFKGHRMNFAYCLEQYGAPLLGKAASKLDAHRINIECFLKYSDTSSNDENSKSITTH